MNQMLITRWVHISVQSWPGEYIPLESSLELSFFLWSLILITRERSVKCCSGFRPTLAHSLDITEFLLVLTVPSCHPEFSLAQGRKVRNQKERNLMVSLGTLIKQPMSSLWNASFMGLPAGGERYSHNASQMETSHPLNFSKLIQFIYLGFLLLLLRHFSRVRLCATP